MCVRLLLMCALRCCRKAKAEIQKILIELGELRTKEVSLASHQHRIRSSSLDCFFCYQNAFRAELTQATSDLNRTHVRRFWLSDGGLFSTSLSRF